MPSTKSVLFPPTKDTTQKWMFSVQNLHPLIKIDTSAGSYSEALPPAGALSGTGQNNQNQEIVVLKVSSDGNTYTLTGAATGTVTVTTQYAGFRFKSDGTSWFKVGTI